MSQVDISARLISEASANSGINLEMITAGVEAGVLKVIADEGVSGSFKAFYAARFNKDDPSYSSSRARQQVFLNRHFETGDHWFRVMVRQDHEQIWSELDGSVLKSQAAFLECDASEFLVRASAWMTNVFTNHHRLDEFRESVQEYKDLMRGIEEALGDSRITLSPDYES